MSKEDSLGVYSEPPLTNM
uniref:Uncharacterized protein n=1 Tax=Anguilla anguilla TaxID=7936 RepID=A0A0E9UG78_ANGAN